ncbi:MAG: DUF1569 domain-containing protein [Sphingobacteriales bacterium]|nr:MAG: DUF1569 domain-containing protein [Sphingobacteriales bacterium]
MQEEKLSFLKQDLFVLLNNLRENSVAQWGVMNAQQMLEHVADFFEVSYEKIIFPLSVPEEHLPKYKAFLWSDKEFRENTKAPANVLGDVPIPIRQPSLEAAKKNLQQSIGQFMEWFKDDTSRTSVHPAFGPLNFEEWIILHHKHVRHHLKQFGLID